MGTEEQQFNKQTKQQWERFWVPFQDKRNEIVGHIGIFYCVYPVACIMPSHSTERGPAIA